MEAFSEDQVLEVLKSVKYPGFSRDIVSFGLVKGIETDGGVVRVRLVLSTGDTSVPAKIRADALAALAGLPGNPRAEVLIDIQAPPQTAGADTRSGIPGVRHILAVASGKGGVGKSTVAANLATALSRSGAATGLCDCDLYGPSVALMFGSNERPMADEQERIIPIERYGIRIMSMGLLTDDTSPVVLRGPMVTRYTQQFLRQVHWGELDYLVLDLPPGTGDIQLTIVQTVALDGALIVTTPQEVALIDARKAASMFAKTSVEVLGIIENMSYFICPNDGNHYDIFGSGGGAREARRLGVPLLGQIPLEIAIREAGDKGRPLADVEPASTTGEAFAALAAAIRARVEQG